MLKNSGRKIAYSRLRVTDATGKELIARMEVSGGKDAFHRVPIVPEGDQGRGGTHPYLVVVVNDAEAVYPVRIDPTFSDANWSSMGGIPGPNGAVSAAVVDGSGNLYIGGEFTLVGDVFANEIAKWNGTSWTPLGSGLGGGSVSALAVSGSDLYAGGEFTTAGGKVSPYIARAYLPTLPTLSVLRSGIPQGGIMVSWPSVDTASFTLEQGRHAGGSGNLGREYRQHHR